MPKRNAGFAVLFFICALLIVMAIVLKVAQSFKKYVPLTVLNGLEVSVEEIKNWKNVIAYVPLDDRTDNLEDVIYLAKASGYRVVMPARDWYRTALDGQAFNKNGTQFGNREALFEWVKAMDHAGCNLFILSLDQLFSGGLVHSRSISSPQILTFSDSSSMNELEAFNAFILPLANDADNRVYLFDSVVRLSPTVGYQGLGEEEYYGLREYGMVARPTLSEENLTLENVFALYPYAADGVTLAENTLENNKLRNALTDEILKEYINVRRRKLTLLDSVISAIRSQQNQGNIQLLIGIDDSSNTTNIQYNELQYLQKRLGDGAALMAGLDSLARLLMGRIAQEEYNYYVKTAVRYIGGTQAQPSSEFDRYTLQEVVDLHLDFFHAQRVSPEEAEMQIIVMTAPDSPDKKAAYQEELLNILEYNLKNHIPTALNEASNNAYGDELEKALIERISFAGLVAFAGKYDQANVTGAAFAMAFSRFLYLQCCMEKNDACDLAQIQQMANSMALTEYILHVREPLNQYIQKLGVNRNNIITDAATENEIFQQLGKLFRPDCWRVCNNLKNSSLLSSLSPYTEKNIVYVSITDFYFPWNRTFEISFTVHPMLSQSS